MICLRSQFSLTLMMILTVTSMTFMAAGAKTVGGKKSVNSSSKCGMASAYDAFVKLVRLPETLPKSVEEVPDDVPDEPEAPGVPVLTDLSVNPTGGVISVEPCTSFPVGNEMLRAVYMDPLTLNAGFSNLHQYTSLTEYLAGLGLYLHSVPGDGSCLFESVMCQIEHRDVSAVYLRRQLVMFMATFPEHVFSNSVLLNLVSNCSGEMERLGVPLSVCSYLECMLMGNLWGDLAVILALQKMWALRIFILSYSKDDDAVSFQRPACHTWALKDCHLVLSYNGVDHYNAILPCSDKFLVWSTKLCQLGSSGSLRGGALTKLMDFLHSDALERGVHFGLKRTAHERGVLEWRNAEKRRKLDVAVGDIVNVGDAARLTGDVTYSGDSHCKNVQVASGGAYIDGASHNIQLGPTAKVVDLSTVMDKLDGISTTLKETLSSVTTSRVAKKVVKRVSTAVESSVLSESVCSENDSVLSGQQMFGCTLCEKQYTTKKGLAQHRKTHEGLKFSCNMCKTVVTTLKGLQAHCNNMHSFEYEENKVQGSEAARTCTKCGTVVSAYLCVAQLHISTCKRKVTVRGFKCKECDKSYGQKKDLYRHMRLKHPNV